MYWNNCKFCKHELNILELRDMVCLDCLKDIDEYSFINPTFNREVIRLNRKTKYDEISNKELFEKLYNNEKIQKVLKDNIPDSRRHYRHVYIRTYTEKRNYLGIDYYIDVDRHFRIYTNTLEERDIIYHAHFDEKIDKIISDYNCFDSAFAIAEDYEQIVEDRLHTIIDKLKRKINTQILDYQNKSKMYLHKLRTLKDKIERENCYDKIYELDNKIEELEKIFEVK